MYDTSFYVEALSDILYPHLVETEDLGKHLEFTEETLRKISAEAVALNLAKLDDEIKDQVPKNWKILEKPERTLITLVGAITYKRRCYLDEYGYRRYLLDEICGINAYQRIESSAFLWIIRKSANVSYEKTRVDFFDKTGVPITRTTVMRCVHKEGELLAEAYAEKGNARCISAPVLFAEFDGFWVHLQVPTKTALRPRRTYKEQFKKKSKEMKVWVAYAGKDKDKRICPVHWASDAEPEDFFSECVNRTATVYDTEELDYIRAGSDGASWCKNHTIDELSAKHTTVTSKLDTFHVNQKVYRAFSSEEDRSTYLNFLYARDFEGFFDALDASLIDGKDDERYKQRVELHSYIMGNLDWLGGLSLSGHIRERLLEDLRAVFGERSFYHYLAALLEHRCYKRFLATLKTIVKRCDDHLHYDYKNYLYDAQAALAQIERYRPVRLGSMEGTNAKTYAARLKVWGCAWSERGALAMMRIRATIASGAKLIAPRRSAWLNSEEKASREKARYFNCKVPYSAGSNYEPPKARVALFAHMPARLYGVLNYT